MIKDEKRGLYICDICGHKIPIQYSSLTVEELRKYIYSHIKQHALHMKDSREPINQDVDSYNISRFE